jgi:hypothetical protein
MGRRNIEETHRTRSNGEKKHRRNTQNKELWGKRNENWGENI